MAPFALLSGRRLAQRSEPVSPLVGSFVSVRSPGSSYHFERESDRVPSPPSAIFARSSDSPVNPLPQIPSATAGLIGFICFLVVGIMIVGGWRIFRWRRRRNGSQQSVLPTADPLAEKRLRPFILVPPIPLSPSVRWAPSRVSPWLDPNMPRKPAPSLSKDTIMSRWSFDSVVKSASTLDIPSSSSSEYPSSVDSKTGLLLPILPLAIRSKVAGKQEAVPIEVVQSPAPISTLGIPKPRVQSISSPSDLKNSNKVTPKGANSPSETDSEIGSSECSPVIESAAQPGYPKLVIVKRTFAVNLPDELKVREGDRLRILREFKDGWALCQRTARRNPEKGAVPICCLTELSVNTKKARAGNKGNKSEVAKEKG